jgi:eukaryotic-like serine/threonine-protein kinase
VVVENGKRSASDVPNHIGRYRVLGNLGEWPMGWYLHGRDDTVGRDVLLKTLFAERASEPEPCARLRHEALVAAKLCHPNIITIIELGVHDGVPFIACEALKGERLSESMNRGISLRQGIPIILQVLEGLAYLHANGVVHRDVNPDGIFVCAHGSAKVTNLWLARLMPGPGHRTSTAVLLAAPSYVAPEQTQDYHVDGRSDLFSLGCVLYEMIAGQTPFCGDSVSELLFKIVSAAPDMEQLPSGNRWERVRRVLARALEKDPKDRYPDARTMRTDLQAALKELSEDAEWTKPRMGPAPTHG